MVINLCVRWMLMYRVFLLNGPPDIVRVQIPLFLAQFATVNVANVVNIIGFEFQFFLISGSQKKYPVSI